MQNNQQNYELYVQSSHAYYNTDESILTDDEFDDLREILLMDEFYREKIIDKIMDSSGNLVDVKELTSQMLSLFKIKYKESNDEAKKEIIDFLGVAEYLSSLKFDGMAIKVSNKNNSKIVITRGGQDFTHLLADHKDIKNITRPITHGEMVIKEEIFQEHYSHLYKNKRNCILGVLKINPAHLDFVELTDGVNHLVESPYVFPLPNDVDLLEYFNELKKDSPYLFDGLVVSKKCETQTVKDNYPTNSVAVKFPSATAKTKVTGMFWSQKKTNNLTPVITIEPTLLDGATITKLSGYNYGFLVEKGIGVGAEISITRSGDIIPVVDEVFVKSNNIIFPDGEWYIDDINLISENSYESELYKFVLGFNVMQIDGFGDVLARKLGVLLDNDIFQLFNPNNRKLIEEKFTKILGQKLAVIYDIKSLPLNEIINMMQLPNCGANTSMKLAQLITKQTTETKGLNKILLADIISGDSSAKLKYTLSQLRSFGVEVTPPHIQNEETITYEMTGSPQNGMTKSVFMKQLSETKPNWIHTSLNKDTKVLIVDSLSSSSSKCNKARKYNSKIITYEEALLNN